MPSSGNRASNYGPLLSTMNHKLEVIEMKKSIVLFLIICFGIVNFSTADEPKRVAQATMSFLNIDVGARAVAMGGSFVCMDNDA